MESANDKADSASQENPNSNSHRNLSNQDAENLNGGVAGNRPPRTPFTDLSQVDADAALARTLQEQVFPFKSVFRCFLFFMVAFILC